MNKFFAFTLISFLSLTAPASWYWPFSSDEKEPPRLSELMEKASELIDEASDLAADGKVSESVAKYREALAELDRVESENPDRIDKPEFATLKTKRAYISAAIDSMLLSQAKQSARAIAVSDTGELEKKLKAERGELVEEPQVTAPQAEERAPEELPEVVEAIKDEKRAKVQAKVKKVKAETKAKAKAKTKAKKAKGKTVKKPSTPREMVIEAIAKGDYAKADEVIAKMLEETPNNAMALNLKAVCECSQEKYEQAEATLDQAIRSNPRDYHAYYNMAMLYLQAKSDKKSAARRYYETGRTFGGPEDAELEAELK